ncbi:MAG: mechanosensitive ion channel [Spirochaetales bacterium]|nr:mechanosensitive ion channel [Spirochaetales bacterium]
MMEFLQSIFRFKLTFGEFELYPAIVVIQVIVPIAGAYIIYKTVLSLYKRISFNSKKLDKATREKTIKRLQLIMKLFVFTVIVAALLIYFGTRIPQYIKAIWEIFQNPFVVSGSTKISIMTIILAIPVFLIASWISRLTRGVIDNRLLSRVKVDKSTKFTISSLIRYSMLIIVLIMGLTIIGIDLSSIAVLLGVLGIAIGFGLQNTFANIFAGIVIIFERPIKEGDRILVNGIEGDIIRIKLRSTTINTLTNETIILPNSQLVDHQVQNYSFHDPEIIIMNTVSVSYSTDLEKACRILLGVAGSNPFSEEGQTHKARVLEFGSSGISLELRTWIRDAHDKLDAIAWTNMEIWRSFKREGITIPFPQLDVHMGPSQTLAGLPGKMKKG